MLFQLIQNHVLFSPDEGGSSTNSDDQEPEVITFTEEEGNNLADIEAPPAHVQEDINTFVGLIERQRNNLLDALLTALDNFETTMSFASEEEAKPDVLGTLLSTAFDTAADMALADIPGGPFAKKLFDATTAELERAGKASQSLEVGLWIKDQRTVLANEKMQSTQDTSDRLRNDLEDEFLDGDGEGRKEFWEQIVEANTRMQGTPAYNHEDLEAKLYELFINGHFDENWIEDTLSGCIEYKLKYDTDEFSVDSCKVRAPFGDHIGTALNHLMDGNTLHDIRFPLDLKVRKRICLYTDDYVPGGKDWFCGWLDASNNVTSSPSKSEAIQGFSDSKWRGLVTRFG
jgi:hypothetical protein